MKAQKKPIIVEVHQWFKNGDHSLDYAEPRDGLQDGMMVTFTRDYLRDQRWEGAIVRYFRRPDVSGSDNCRECGMTMHFHGWIDTKEGGTLFVHRIGSLPELPGRCIHVRQRFSIRPTTYYQK